MQLILPSAFSKLLLVKPLTCRCARLFQKYNENLFDQCLDVSDLHTILHVIKPYIKFFKG